MPQFMDGGRKKRAAERSAAAEKAGEGKEQKRAAADLQAEVRSLSEGGLFV